MLVPDVSKASIIKEGFEGYASGRFQTLSELKRFFETTDVFAKNKQGEIHPTRIQEMIECIIYAGYISYMPWGLNMIEDKCLVPECAGIRYTDLSTGEKLLD